MLSWLKTKGGPPCPKCGEGRLRASGELEWREEKSFDAFLGFREYECDRCGRRFRAHVVTLHEEG
ncbi:hypothetical protein DRO42_02550 [Candidatus Bathyarchaeota archaeon]|nr:MAG: hypothetical protein DRO42_02550 [Candidatus Bathyarchaeota archaeon]